MKKFAVIAAMALSMTAMTACGNSNQDKTKDSNVAEEQKQDTETTDKTDETETMDKTETEENADAQEEDTENAAGAEENESAAEPESDGKEEETELLEAGEKPDFKLNENGCFNGKYKGNDGCEYEFTEEGKLTIISDSETLVYQYALKDDILNMVAEDGSIGVARQITLLEDGTYLLDDCEGTQVILTYTGE